VTPEQWEQVVAWARASGRDVSDFVRAAVFQGTHATAAALAEARRHEGEAVRKEGDRQLRALRAELERAKESRAGWQRRAQELEQRLLFASDDLMYAVRTMLAGRSGARSELARLWACMPRNERLRILPAVADAALERLENLRERTYGWRFLFERHGQLLSRVLWLMESLRPEAGYGAKAPLRPEWDAVGTALDEAIAGFEQNRKSAQRSPDRSAVEPSASS
jgi:hypothetical protein